MRHLEKEELFIGAWVQEWPQVPQDFCPMKVKEIYSLGETVLDASGEIVKASLDDLRGLPVNEETMRGFGFSEARGVWVKIIDDLRLTLSLRPMRGGLPCRRVAISGRFACWNEEIRYIHELQRWWVDKVLLPYGIELELEWRGTE